MKENPLVSIIALNFNQTDVTCAFLESTKKLKYTHFETIVIDNASNTDPTEQIQAGNYPNVHLIVSDKNLGFTGGNNLGIREAQGDFVFIVNNDTEVTPDLINLLLEPFYQDEKIGVTSPKIKFYDHPDIIQYAGFRPMNPYTGRTEMVGGRQPDDGQYDTPGETYGAHGAAMMVKREVIEKVGTFADHFFIYYEEWDWSARIRRAGYKIFYQPRAMIFHKESMTMGKESAIKAYYHTRNRILYMRRNSEQEQFLAFAAFFTFFTVPKSVIQYVAKLQFKHLSAFTRGIAWNFKSSHS